MDIETIYQLGRVDFYWLNLFEIKSELSAASELPPNNLSKFHCKKNLKRSTHSTTQPIKNAIESVLNPLIAFHHVDVLHFN